MNASAVVMYVLTFSSGLLTATMGVAWQTLERPRHALFWAAAFGLATLQWFVIAAYNSFWQELPLTFAFANWSAIAVALLLLAGFRARAGLAQWRFASCAAAAAAAAVILIAALSGYRAVVLVLPQVMRAALLLLCAAVMLRNRRHPQLAECWAVSILLAFAVFSVTVAVVRWRACGCELPGFEFLLLVGLPAAYTSTGLSIVLLLAYDLAQRLRRVALEDPLTGLLNRRGFNQAAEQSIGAALRAERAHSIVVADIDHFKSINDRFGHASGDMVLASVAWCISTSVRSGDLVGRIGGEEFAILLKDTSEPEAVRIVEQIRVQLALLDLPLPTPARVTASFGVAAVELLSPSLGDALQRADLALYASKSAGRDRVTSASKLAGF